MENKQTAVEWIIEQVYNSDWKNMSGEDKLKLFKQAKEMEKQQIEDAYDKGSLNHHAQYTEQYDNLKQDYIKTYKSE